MEIRTIPVSGRIVANGTINLGVQMDNEARTMRFMGLPLIESDSRFGSLIWGVPGSASDGDVVTLAYNPENKCWVWPVSNAITQYAGKEIRAYIVVESDGDRVWHSEEFRIVISALPMLPTGAESPEVTHLGELVDTATKVGKLQLMVRSDGHLWGYFPWISEDWQDMGVSEVPGPVGPTGSQGEKGDKGDQGVIGPQGVQGIQGVVGPQGIQGPEGKQGVQGPQGNDGTSVSILGSYDTYEDLIAAHPTGNPGDAYIIDNENGDLFVWDAVTSSWIDVGNIRGPQGTQGIQGIQGIQGQIGPIGPQGVQGIQGEKGDPTDYLAMAKAGFAANVENMGSIAQLKGMIDGIPLGVSISAVATQTGTGDPSPTNIRPISGRAVGNITRCRINLYDSAAVDSANSSSARSVRNDDGSISSTIDNSLGNVQLFANWFTKPSFAYKKDVTYTYIIEFLEASVTGTVGMSLYTVGAGVYDQFSTGSAPNIPIIGIQTVVGQMVCLRNADDPVSGFGLRSFIQCVPGATANIRYRISILPGIVTQEQYSYEPYQGDTYPIALPSPVYGLPGAEDEVDVDSGVVTHETGLMVYDGTQSTGAIIDLGSVVRVPFYIPNAQPLNSARRAICSHLPMAPSFTQDAEHFYIDGPVGSMVCYMFILKTRLSTVDAAGVKTYLAAQAAAGTPVQVLYQLATPTTESITPIQIPALKGLNNIYSDLGGDTTASGYMGVQGIMEMISEMQG